MSFVDLLLLALFIGAISLGVAYLFHIKFPNQIKKIEIAIIAGGIGLCALIFSLIGLHVSTYDTEILNGQVSSKYSAHVSCSHSYDCRCRTEYYYTGSGKNRHRTSRRVCDTCYEHAFDISWYVNTTVGNLTISRVDRQGVVEPPRYSQTIINEPASLEHGYTNYVLASPFSLFSQKEKDETTFNAPNYPTVYDYYRFNRVIGNYPLASQLNTALNNELRTLGASKQVNINVLFTTDTDSAYRYQLENAWLGGKKNDVTVLVGMKTFPNVDWIDVMTFAKNSNNETLAVKLRDALKLTDFQNVQLVSDTIISHIKQYYNRIEMSKFEYLTNERTLSTTSIVVICLLLVLVFGGALWYSFVNEH